MLIAGLQHFLDTSQYLALFTLLAIEEAGVPLPIPGDVAIMLLGYRVTLGQANPLLIVSIVALATFLGSSILYAVSRRLGHPVVVRYGRYIGLSEKRLAKIETWFAEKGTIAIVMGRLIPGLRVPTSIAAGVFEIPYRKFATAAALSAVIWAIAYMFLGMLLGAAYAQVMQSMGDYMRPIALSLVSLAIIGVAGYLLKRGWQRIRSWLSVKNSPSQTMARFFYEAE